jgi:uncharacterized membrane protein YsdA (DUF1294 family)
LRLLFVWLLLVNLLAYVVYWWDKRRAQKGGRRISEKELLMWVLAGGTLGAWLSMRRFRHKTQKTSFRVWFWGIVVVQIAVLYLLMR